MKNLLALIGLGTVTLVVAAVATKLYKDNEEEVKLSYEQAKDKLKDTADLASDKINETVDEASKKLNELTDLAKSKLEKHEECACNEEVCTCEEECDDNCKTKKKKKAE